MQKSIYRFIGVFSFLVLAAMLGCGGGSSSGNSSGTNPSSTPPGFTAQPGNQSVTLGQTTSFTVAAKGDPAPTLQWEKSTDGSTWTAISGAVSATYSFTPSSSDNGAQFRVVATNSQGTVTSSVATLTVAPSATRPSFTAEPSSQNVTAGQTVTLTVTAAGTPTPTLTWEKSTDGSNWTTISGATSATYSFTALSSDNGAQYRAVATNSQGAVTSDVVTLIVGTPSVYVAGVLRSSSDVLVPGYWKDGTWVGLTPLSESRDASANSITVSGSDVYVAGYSKNSSDVKVAGYWKNGTWVGLPTPHSSQEIWGATRIVVSGSDIYVAGGWYVNSSHQAIPGYWKNGIWVDLPPVIASSHNSFAEDIVLSGEDVYVSGDSANGPDLSDVYVPGYWKNGVWVSLATPDGSKGGNAGSIIVSGSDVYASGYSYNSSGVMVPGYWKNGVWNQLPLSGTVRDSQASAITTSGSDVYMSGYYSDTLGVNHAAFWKNGVSGDLENASNRSYSHSITAIGTDVYASGIALYSSGGGSAGYWKNGTWVALPTPDGYTLYDVMKICVR
jgi:hypothetical protein